MGAELRELIYSRLTRWRLTVQMDAVAENGIKKPVSKHQIQSVSRMSGLMWDGTAEPVP